MRDKLLIYTLLLLLTFSVSAIFIYGEQLKNKKDYTLLSFENAEIRIDPQNVHPDNLAVVIQNFQQKTATYQVVYFINDEKIEELEKKVPANKLEKLAAPKKVLAWLKNNQLQGSFELRVQLSQDSKQQEVYKKLQLIEQ